MAFGDLVPFNVMSVYPPVVSFSGPWTDAAIAQELYDDPRLPIVHNPKQVFQIVVSSDWLQDKWRPHFILVSDNKWYAGLINRLDNCDANVVALAYRVALEGQLPNCGPLLDAAEKALERKGEELAEPWLNWLYDNLVFQSNFFQRPSVPLSFGFVREWKHKRNPFFARWDARRKGQRVPIVLPFDPFAGPTIGAPDVRMVALEKMVNAGPIGVLTGVTCILWGTDTQTLVNVLRVAEAADGVAAAVGATAMNRSTGNRSPLPPPSGRSGAGAGGPAASFKAINKSPGQYEFTPSASGRTEVAEGWVTNQAAPINKDVHRAVTQGLNGYHAGHLIPARFNGPSVANNLVPMPEVTNVSYVKSVENAVARHTAQGPVYLKVTVTYGSNSRVPSTVKHEFFRRTAAGKMEKIAGGDVITNVGDVPSAPMGQATDPYTGKKVAPKDFLDPQNTKGVGPAGPH